MLAALSPSKDLHGARTSRPGLALALAIAISSAPLVRAQPATATAATTYGVSVAKDIMIPMRDGVRLATDVYRPAKDGAPVDGKFPALHMRTPYDKTLRAPSFANYFTTRGYVVVVQDVRARYHSEGHWRPLTDDPNDGYDTARWIGQQPWSDGGIGNARHLL